MNSTSNDVFHMKRLKVGVVLVQSAKFASAFGSVPNQRTKAWVHHTLDDLPSSNRALDLSRATKVPKLT